MNLLAKVRVVVICFHFTTFAVLETTPDASFQWRQVLWFAFILLPLPYWKQPGGRAVCSPVCCDLLSFYYLCRTGNSIYSHGELLTEVVICFHFTTFAVLETASGKKRWNHSGLWFAFILLPLPYWKQPYHAKGLDYDSCDLLSFYYLCRTGNSLFPLMRMAMYVVICFHFTTFAVLETAVTKGHPHRVSCDLLSFYYLCRTGNSQLSFYDALQQVVICFHFTTFAVLETAIEW